MFTYFHICRKMLSTQPLNNPSCLHSRKYNELQQKKIFFLLDGQKTGTETKNFFNKCNCHMTICISTRVSMGKQNITWYQCPFKTQANSMNAPLLYFQVMVVLPQHYGNQLDISDSVSLNWRPSRILMQHILQQTLHTGKTSVASYSEKLTQNSAYCETREEFCMLAITTSHHINENAAGT